MRPHAPNDEAGFSLIELLIAVVILGIGATAVVAAMGTAIIGSNTHRSLASAEAVTRDFSEALKSELATTPYTNCPTLSEFSGVSVTPPAGFTIQSVDADATKVEWWNPDNPNDGDPKTGTFLDMAVAANRTLCQDRYENDTCPAQPDPRPAYCDSGLVRVTFAVVIGDQSKPEGVTETARILLRRGDT
jgi:prepilin-type N-terminal cleavage/methylation domain-containing protein